MAESPQPPAKRLATLDFVRGVAILLVLFWHAPHVPMSKGLEVALSPFLRTGWAGVDVFFVLSGFLVGGLLIKEWKRTGSLDAKRFLVRRAFKIWPQYYLFLLFVTAIKLAKRDGLSDYLLPNYVHLQNYLVSVIPHTWSLAVEEHFYLSVVVLLALAIWRFKRFDFAGFSWAAGFVIAAVLAFRVVALSHAQTEYDHYRISVMTHTRIDSLALGVWMAACYHLRPELFARIARPRALLGVLVVAGLFVPFSFHKYSPFVQTVGYSVIALGAASLLILVMEAEPGVGFWGKPQRQFWYRWISGIGFYSYGIYLWQGERLMGFVQHRLPSGFPPDLVWPVLFAVSLFESIALGVVMTRLIETPFLKLRDRMMPSKVAGALRHSDRP